MNLFAVSSILTALASLGFGFSIYYADRSSRIGRLWLVLSIAIACWAFGLFGVTSSNDSASALVWQNFLDVSAMFIPLCYLLFVMASLEIDLPILTGGVSIALICLLLLSFTPYYKLGVASDTFGFFWVKPGPLYFLFPLYFAGVTVIALYLLVRAYQAHRADPAKSGQILNHIIAAVVGFGGGTTNFFPQLFNMYPFGNYFVILYVAIMSYAVLQYRFFGIKMISTQLFAGGIVLAALFNIFSSVSLEAWIIQFGELIIVGAFSYLLVRSVYMEAEQRRRIELQEKDLELANHQQETLLHFISHEIKGYLARSEAAFAGITQGDYGSVSAPLKQMASTELDDMRKGVDTVMNILSASDLKKGTVEFRKAPFDFRAIATKVIEDQRPAAYEKHLGLDVKIADGKYSMEGDGEKIREHVIRNLIDNAIKYTPAGTVHVELSDGDGKIHFSVQDSGVGITQEDMAHLFTEGGHGKDSIKVNVHSTGYGLFIAKEIVEAHHGRIWAESGGQGKGSRFIVELPAS